jgi:LPS export ABC transporter protein LptC
MIKHITVALVTVMCFFVSCTEKKEFVEVSDRASMAKLSATDVITLVSDSGITRYRVNAKVWNVYDKAEEPYWDFPEGIHFDRFDPDMKVDAEIESKKAIYYTNRKFWDLKDSVHAMNLEGEHFECDQLFWDEKAEKVYTNGKVKITQKDRIIYGKGFESNQTFTKYVIKNPEGIFPIEE